MNTSPGSGKLTTRLTNILLLVVQLLIQSAQLSPGMVKQVLKHTVVLPLWMVTPKLDVIHFKTAMMQMTAMMMMMMKHAVLICQDPKPLPTHSSAVPLNLLPPLLLPSLSLLLSEHEMMWNC